MSSSEKEKEKETESVDLLLLMAAKTTYEQVLLKEKEVAKGSEVIVESSDSQDQHHKRRGAYSWEIQKNDYLKKLIPVKRLLKRSNCLRTGGGSLEALPEQYELASIDIRSKIGLMGLSQGVDLRARLGTVYDQGEVGSCTANAICGAYRMLESDKSFQPSRLYVYAKERLMDAPNEPLTDSGSDAALGLSWIARTGVCTESVWPYNVQKVNVVPPSSCDADAKNHKITGIFDLSQRKGSNTISKQIEIALDSSLPVLLAFSVYESFMSNEVARTGIVPLPNERTEALDGGHEVLIVGYKPLTKQFIVANSWGTSWGDNGCFYLPYAFVEDPNLCFEFLAFTGVVLPPPPPPPPKPTPPKPTPPPPPKPTPPKPQPKPQPKPLPKPHKKGKKSSGSNPLRK